MTHSLHPLLMPARARRAGRHDSRSELSRASRAHARRNPPRLSGARARPCAARRPRHRAVAVHRRRGRAAARACPPTGSPSARRARRTGRRARDRRRDGYVLFFGTLEPRKNVGALLDAYERLLARRRALPELVLAGQADRRSRGRGSTGSAGRRSPAASATSATSIPPIAEQRVRRRPAPGSAVVRGRLRHPGARGDDARRAGRRRQSRRAARSARRRRAARRRRRRRRAGGRDRAAARRRRRSPRRASTQGVARARRFRWTRRPTARRRLLSTGVSAAGASSGALHADRHRRARAVRPRRPASAATSAGCCGEWARGRARAAPRVRALRARAARRWRSTAAGFATRVVAGPGRHLVGAGAAAGRGAHAITWTSSSRPATRAPLVRRVPTVVAIHDVSFAAHPEWFAAREGVRRRWLTRRSARARAGGRHDLRVLAARAGRAASACRRIADSRHSAGHRRARASPPGAPGRPDGRAARSCTSDRSSTAGTCRI